MGKYFTEQRQELLSFLKTHYDRQYSIAELAESLCEGKVISISAIYRNINRMVAEGTVAKISIDSSRKSLYQYIGENNCSEHLHLKCEKCGQLYHMDDQSMEGLLNAAMSLNAFNINKKKSILYGSCKDCLG